MSEIFIPPERRADKENVKMLVAHLKLNGMTNNVDLVLRMWAEIQMHRRREKDTNT